MKNPRPNAIPIRPNAFARSLWRRVVSDIRLSNGEVAGRRAVDDSRQVNHPERRRPREHDEADEGADLADEEQRLAAVAIGGVADERPRQQHAHREHRHQQRRLQRRRAKALCIDRQQRDDERHPEDVNEHDEEYRQQRSRAGCRRLRRGHQRTWIESNLIRTTKS